VEYHHGVIPPDNAMGSTKCWSAYGYNYHCHDGGTVPVHNTQATAGADEAW